MNLRYSRRRLNQLARLYSVQTAYYDVFHERHQASAEALLAVLGSLGAPVATLHDVPTAWRECRQARWQRLLEPVILAWEGAPPLVELRLPSTVADAPLNGYLKLENGEWHHWEWHGVDLPAVDTVEVEGTQYVVKRLPLPGGLPWGYHRFTLELPGRCGESLVISAPLKTYLSPRDNRMWGVFLPLYALYTKTSWGSGNFADLEAQIEWVAGMGGKVLATLPLLATFLNQPFEPSPYLPVSRLVWNEFYLDVTRVPELKKCPPAQSFLSSPLFRKELETWRNSPRVDYYQEMTLKRRVLEELYQCLFAESSDRLEALRRFAETNPVVEDYACFRATWEKRRISWRSWTEPLREGVLKKGDYEEEARRYHLYVQWLAHQQIQSLSEKARGRGLRLYLDLPLGVHPEGYDIWRERGAFALDASAGAPPDAVFTNGQDWQFPPLHPEKSREQGYRYFIAYLRHHLEHAGILRIDHVMGFHRLFWIPRGLEASQGVYVRYPAEELYAILSLESHRQKTLIVGEDLGTVSAEIRPAMSRHGLHRLYVMQYELVSDRRVTLRPVPARSVTSLNTHDMPPFAAFWQGLDIQQRLELGLLDKADAEEERRTRHAMKKALATFWQEKGWIRVPQPDMETALRASLAFLAASPARVVLVNLEDLWRETQPQNIPSTREEYPNWRRKARYNLEVFCQMPQVIDTLRMIDHLRKQDRHNDA